MNYTSTRQRNLSVPSARAILQGISKEGGLFVPEALPTLTREDLAALMNMDYPARARWVLSRFLTDFAGEELGAFIREAYAFGAFDGNNPAPLKPLGEEGFLLELWHGPTCAFKDMALQLTPKLLIAAAEKCGCDKEVAILVATSGDTGKAALEGFRNLPGARIQVFYPTEGVSRMQKLQMASQQGENVSVVGVRGNFDDCQNGVKAVFTSGAAARRAKAGGFVLSSANSINWGRLVPQIVYYVSAYCDLAAGGQIALGETVNICVPTGNFGNILAAYYAKGMGLPVGRLICASNRNNVLTDFINTGRYDRNRPFFVTASPSMDILISSNLERLLYHLSGCDTALVADLMKELAQRGAYILPHGMHRELARDFYGAFSSEEETENIIRDVLAQYGYLLDPHTAVAVRAARKYREESGDTAPVITVSTASPYKFTHSVLKALGTAAVPDDDFAQMDLLREISGMPVPAPLLALRGAVPRFTAVCDPGGMAEAVDSFLKK